jgi:hypothetical protein
LAVKSCNELNSTRPVRFLLIAGASRNIRDNNSRLPQDYAEQILDEKIKKDLKEMLSIPS